MKALLLIVAVALAVPAASFADHYRPYAYGGYHHGYRPYYRPYGYYPWFGYYGPGAVVAFDSGSRPYVYDATRYYVPGGSSMEADVQRALSRKGYYSGAVDGDLGPRSRAAIREYQADHDLAVTGRIDARLLRSLGL